MPNEPIDVEAGEDLDGHGPLLLGRAPPVNPSPRFRPSCGSPAEVVL